MTYLYEALDKPTRLYIKKCSHCNLKYFGKTSSDHVEAYVGSGVYWLRHLEKHGAHSIHLWNSDWYIDTSICRFATKFSYMNKIVQSENWANLAIENGIQGGYLGESVNKKIAAAVSKTKSNPEWKSTTGKEASVKSSETLHATFNDPVWKSTIGAVKARKISDTRSDELWKQTIGSKSRIKHSKTKSNPAWKDTTGIIQAKKQSDTKQSEAWKNTVGIDRIHKYSEKVNSDEWKQSVYKTCEYCGKGPMNPSNYVRWHGDKCKNG